MRFLGVILLTMIFASQALAQEDVRDFQGVPLGISYTWISKPGQSTSPIVITAREADGVLASLQAYPWNTSLAYFLRLASLVDAEINDGDDETIRARVRCTNIRMKDYLDAPRFCTIHRIEIESYKFEECFFVTKQGRNEYNFCP